MNTRSTKKPDGFGDLNGRIKHLRISAADFDNLYLSLLWRMEDGRLLWHGRITHRLATAFTVEVSPAVASYIQLLMETKDARLLDATLRNHHGYTRQV